MAIFVIGKYAKANSPLVAEQIVSERLFPGRQMFFVSKHEGESATGVVVTSIVSEVHEVASLQEFLKDPENIF